MVIIFWVYLSKQTKFNPSLFQSQALLFLAFAIAKIMIKAFSEYWFDKDFGRRAEAGNERASVSFR